MLILSLLAATGLTFLLKYKILPPIVHLTGWYWLDEIMSCSLCLGWWSGWLVIAPIGFRLGFSLETIILFPFASSATVWILDSVVGLLQSFTIHD